MIMTWLVDGEEGAEAARRRLKRLARAPAVANNPPPDCEFVPETAEEKRAMQLEVERQRQRQRSETDEYRERKQREHLRRYENEDPEKKKKKLAKIRRLYLSRADERKAIKTADGSN